MGIAMRDKVSGNLSETAHPAFLAFGGGYDTETPRWAVAPGRLKDAQNYEITVNGQYQDVVGYEAFDGQRAPSDATYVVIDVTITGSFSDGDAVTQLVSGATGVVIAVVTSTTPNYLAMTKVTGTFDATNALQVSASTEGTAASLASPGGARTQKLGAQYKNLAADQYRSDIAAVPGQGNVWGVFWLAGVKYAIRNKTGGATAEIYKSSGAGWVRVELGKELPFTSGGEAYTPVEGDTITGNTSTETAVITRIVLESGTFAGGDAAGRFIYAISSGAFQAETLDIGANTNVANTNVATIAADGTAITLRPDGQLDWRAGSFGGEDASDRVYAADSVNPGWEFDGTVFVPIDTGMTVDTPDHVELHKLHLFFSFGNSIQHSGITTQYIWSPVFGASEIAAESACVGFSVEPGDEGNDALGIHCENRLYTLYGNSSADWNLVRYRKEIGAYEWTAQQLASTLFLDDQGLTTLKTVQAFGNFLHSTLSKHIQTWLTNQRVKAVASCIVRDKNQYRLFFSDDQALYVTMDGNKLLGMMPVLLGHTVTSICSIRATDGSEEIYFGSDDGFVYQMEKGTSFNGANIQAYMTFHPRHPKLGYEMHYHTVRLDGIGTTYAEFQFTYELGYAISTIPQPEVLTQSLTFSTGEWDGEGLVWDSGFWDGTAAAPARMKLGGDAEAIALTLRKNSDYMAPIKWTGALFRESTGRQVR